MTNYSQSEGQAVAHAGANDAHVEHEAALHAMRQNLAAIYEASGDGLALCQAIFDADGHVVDYQVLEVNRAHGELNKVTREVMLSKRVSTIYPPVDQRWFDTAETVLKTSVMQDFDIRSRATGRWLNIRVSRVSDVLFQQTFVDVSERHRLDEQRKAMLKEMSHRVMNNFQMVASFLHLQANLADDAARTQLKTAEQRVHVLAKLHSLLAYTESEADIDAGAYVRELCGHLASTFERPHAVRLTCTADEIPLPTDQVVPLGFIISELVTNSAKYAYPAPASGDVIVAFTVSEDGWTLVIEDKGQGVQDKAFKKSGGLGTRLVGLFIKQMGAVHVSTSVGGVRHEVSYRTAK